MKSDRTKPESDEKERNIVSFALGLGFAVAGPLAVFIILGVWLDGLWNTRPLFILLGILLGLVSAVFAFARLLILSSAESKSEESDNQNKSRK
jgi:F0F1-type ATP synthase assembly protein I